MLLAVGPGGVRYIFGVQRCTKPGVYWGLRPGDLPLTEKARLALYRLDRFARALSIPLGTEHRLNGTSAREERPATNEDTCNLIITSRSILLLGGRLPRSC